MNSDYDVLHVLVACSGNNVGAAAPALEYLGAEGPFDAGYHGSYAFSGCTGSAPRYYTRTEVRPRYHGPAIVAQIISTPAAQKGAFTNERYKPRWDLICSLTVDGATVRQTPH